ncbi:putative F-box domain-containing protein [Seiridium cardinale]|uniref:F-box domain-containing protein n=1 Tax=Seiridium cardinale TaxID=138064 RepID=A0ABR2XYK7_9PEZI
MDARNSIQSQSSHIRKPSSLNNVIFIGFAEPCAMDLSQGRPLIELDDKLFFHDGKPRLGKDRRHVSLANLVSKPLIASLQKSRRRLRLLRDSMRIERDSPSQRAIRKLNILDLPNELLITIFENVKGKPSKGSLFNYSSCDRRSVASVRLTCHRFCDTSSHLLIDRIDVSPSAESTARLDQISRHPSINKGVKAVVLCALNYRPENMANFQRFAETCYITLRRCILGSLSSIFKIEKLSDERRDELLRAALDIANSWESFVYSGYPRPFVHKANPQHIEGLRKAFEKCVEAHRVQESLIEESGFVEAIVGAAERIPPFQIGITTHRLRDLEDLAEFPAKLAEY